MPVSQARTHLTEQEREELSRRNREANEQSERNAQARGNG